MCKYKKSLQYIIGLVEIVHKGLSNIDIMNMLSEFESNDNIHCISQFKDRWDDSDKSLISVNKTVHPHEVIISINGEISRWEMLIYTFGEK